jgi:fatty-acyl-CoA synthase
VVEIDLNGQARCAAFVIADGAVDLKDEPRLAHLRERLASYKVPARIFFVDAFPVTESANGVKVQRGRLRAMAMEWMAKDQG